MLNLLKGTIHKDALIEALRSDESGDFLVNDELVEFIEDIEHNKEYKEYVKYLKTKCYENL